MNQCIRKNSLFGNGRGMGVSQLAGDASTTLSTCAAGWASIDSIVVRQAHATSEIPAAQVSAGSWNTTALA